MTGAKRRIAVLGFSHETMLAAPLPLAGSDIRIWRGSDLCGGGLGTISAMVEALGSADVDLLPIMFVRCLPGGPMPRATYAALKAGLRERLEAALPLDGVCVANHGAMELTGLSTSGDTDVLAMVRSVVGPAAKIVVALDLHGHVTPEALSVVDGWAAYRTAPHEDAHETGLAAAALLLRLLADDLRPVTAAVRVPLLLPGECAMTTVEPARSLYARLRDIDRAPGVLGSALLVGFAWNDVPWGGAHVLVTHRDSAEAARTLAEDLAGEVWARRRDFGLAGEVLPVAAGLRQAAEDKGGALYLSDAGDNVTAGATGDLTGVLAAALAEPALSDIAVPGIFAPGAVHRCHGLSPGEAITLTLGAEHRSSPPAPLALSATLLGRGRMNDGAWVRLRAGHVTLTLHETRCAITGPDDLRALGIDPRAHRAYAVKLGYLHPGLAALARRHILLLSDGAAKLDLSHVDYRALPRPVFPLDPLMTWSAVGAAVLAGTATAGSAGGGTPRERHGACHR
ncbi:MAG: M81 family metallopeptidase [Paracoccaceae bacterium]|nr:M81 family metallopeptidase [Paracoccaceae bacterium]